jgi:transcription initiation factor TFIID TATA-box-binding protein
MSYYTHPTNATQAKAFVAPGSFSCPNDPQAATINPLSEPSPQSVATSIVPKVANVVATVNLGVRLDLKDIALKARNCEYNPKRFSAIVMRIREPKATGLIFGSGKMVVTGAQSEDDARLAARKFARIVNKLGNNVIFTEFKVQNIVGTLNVGHQLRLEGLYAKHTYFCHYEPELFPGLIYRMARPKVTLMIFHTGNVVVTGAKTRQNMQEAFDLMVPELHHFPSHNQ